MCITLLVSTAKCANETDCLNVLLSRQCRCGVGSAAMLFPLPLLEYEAFLTVDGHEVDRLLGEEQSRPPHNSPKLEGH